jgi:diaminopimelate decarboxylase
VELPAAVAGDIIAVFATGAYNHSMASNYNRLPRPPVVFVGDGQAREVVRRETYCDMLATDLIGGPDRAR